MTGKTITVAGQRLKLNSITDYQISFVTSAFEDGSLKMDVQLHSAIIGMVAEVICPQLPKSLYQKSGNTYWWKGTSEAFGALLDGLWISYWEGVKNTSTDKDELEMAQMQIDLYHANKVDLEQVEEQPGRDINALLAEIKELKEKAGIL